MAVIFIVSLVLAFIVVNTAQKLYMKMIGADVMFFNGKKKLIAVGIVALLIAGSIGKLFGVM